MKLMGTCGANFGAKRACAYFVKRIAAATVLALIAAGIAPSAMAQISVTEGGTAAYSLPIGVPPGIAGMAPILGLAYTGGGANGPVGYGWGLHGISTITRCPQTRTIDGFTRAVSFTSEDKLCLDGQRLIQTDANGNVVNGTVVNPSASNPFQSADSLGGASNTVAVREYRTEKDSFARIRAYGSAGGAAANGPAFFKVWTKSGQIYEYGNNANASASAAITAQGKSVVVAWAVSRTSDTLGNYVDFQYEQRDFAWGSGPTAGSPTAGHEWRLVEVRYTGTVTQPPANKVVFTYDERSNTAATGPQLDLSEGYALGSKNVSNWRLNSVRTYVNAQAGATPIKVKTVKLIYDHGGTTKRSRLQQVTECAGAAETKCLPPTIFNYANGGGDTFQPNPQFASDALSITGMINAAGTYGVVPVDFNGDGKTDLLRWSDNPSENKLYLSNGTGSFTQATNFTQTGATDNLFKSNGCFTTLVTDINGDGLPDLVRYSAGVSIDGAACPSPPPLALYKNNGDGSFGTFTYTGPALGRLVSTTQTCIKPEVTGCSHSGWTRGATFYFLDVDGDGIPDLLTTELPANPTNSEPGDVTCSGCTRYFKGDGQGGS